MLKVYDFKYNEVSKHFLRDVSPSVKHVNNVNGIIKAHMWLW